MPATARPTQAHSHAGGQAGAKPKLYNPRHPERTLFYQTIAEHFETWHELASAGQPVRQWVLSVPKRLRYFMQRDGAVLNMVLRIFLRVIAQSLQSNSPGTAQLDRAALHIGAVAFIHRFGSSLNGHVHFHVCVVDGVFEEVPGDTDAQSSPPGVIFHPASAIDETAVAQVQTDLRRRILRAFVGRGLLASCDAKEMLGYQHSGFSVDAGVSAWKSRSMRFSGAELISQR
jgi:hypothetical protein